MSDNIIRTGLNLMNTAFNGQDGIVISGDAVKGGYFVTPSIEITEKGEEGKIPDYACVLGTLCYCSTDKKFYQYLPITEEIDGVTTTTNKWINIRLNDVAERLDAEVARATSAEAKLSDTIKSEGIRITEDLTSIREEANKEAYKVSTLIGGQQDEDKSVRTIANEELAAQLLSDSADASFRTLQELAAWLEDHPEDVAAINTAIALNAENIAKEEKRAKGTENSLRSALNEEIQLREAQINGLNFSTKEEVNRAKEAEKLLDDRITAESSRALDAESGLADDLKSESLRATEAERELLEALGITQQLVEENKQSIVEENVRARTAEASVSEKVDTEAARAILAEDRIRNSLIAEEQRALEAEELLREDLKTNFGEISTLLEEETNRAETVEKELSEALAAEVSRATGAEEDLEKTIKEYVNNLLFNSEFIIDCSGIGEP